MTYNMATFTALAAAQAEADDRLRCVLAAREETIGDAVQAGVTLAAIADALSIAVPTVAASRDRALADSPPPAGVEPRLTPAWGEVYDTGPDGDVVDHYYDVAEWAEDTAHEWGMEVEDVEPFIEARYDPRSGELTAETTLAIHHDIWEHHRDAAVGATELRGLRAWRYRQGFTLTPPEAMILAAAKAGAYREAVAQAAAVPRGEVDYLIDGDLGWADEPSDAAVSAACTALARVVETSNAALTPSQLRCAIAPRLHHAAITALDHLRSEGWVTPEDDSPHARLRRGGGADGVPRWSTPYTTPGPE